MNENFIFFNELRLKNENLVSMKNYGSKTSTCDPDSTCE